jgi:hypothetical protein
MTATESLLPEIINDFFNKIGTSLPSTDVRSTAAPGGDPDIEPTPPEGRL